MLKLIVNNVMHILKYDFQILAETQLLAVTPQCGYTISVSLAGLIDNNRSDVLICHSLPHLML